MVMVNGQPASRRPAQNSFASGHACCCMYEGWKKRTILRTLRKCRSSANGGHKYAPEESTLRTVREMYLCGRHMRKDPEAVGAFMIGRFDQDGRPGWNVATIAADSSCRKLIKEYSVFCGLGQCFKRVRALVIVQARLPSTQGERVRCYEASTTRWQHTYLWTGLSREYMYISMMDVIYFEEQTM